MAKTQERTSDWITSAPISFERSSTMAATADVVWHELATNETWVDWFPGFRASHFTSAPPYGVDSIRFVHQDQFKVTERITEWVPNKRWAMTVVEMNMPVVASMAEDVDLLENDGHTLVTWRIGVELTKLASPLRRPLQKKSIAGLETALDNLSRRVEDR